MKTFIYLSKYHRHVFKGLIKQGKFTDLKLLRSYLKTSIDNYHKK